MGNSEAIIKQNLQYIHKSLSNETFHEQQPIIQIMLSETIEEVHETAFKYDVPFSNDKFTAHFKAYANIAEKSKRTLLVDLEDLQMELSRRKTNTKRCLAIIEQILSSDLHKDEVQRSLNKWKPLMNRTAIYRQISVK